MKNLKMCFIEPSCVHSASTKKQREQVWQWAVSGQPAVIVGVHLPALLPLSNLGLIVVDEEHEPGFAEKKHPKNKESK